ncbi:MAG: hypothetical protein GTO51_05610 [Candidatus Latescibacteria bacterium]|nr:hypothetical protein [Candidatus Latescibacterota bacterium]NIM21199.1 hypothetical protein [Candidatus Latescibacterota bacterium]NIM65453.1 hypothetical protein [Candidatus Latescibacterota bacterium]NIO01831.1 hypothetical protein [Candidatus Latescibacterota bacterium]NIO28481.1 hypothetical protein [Candidatus Latescibacterota bacterium]
MNVALIDIGTNSLKLLIAEVSPAKDFSVRHYSRQTTRLGTGLERHGSIQRKGLDRTLSALSRFKDDIQGHRCRRVFALSTHALRDATNAGAVLHAIEEHIGVRPKILTGMEEARFAFISAKRRLLLDKPHTILFDIGGGSTEFVHARNGKIETVQSLPLGALHLTEQFLKSDPIDSEEYSRLEVHIENVFQQSRPPLQFEGVEPSDLDLVASGGSVSTLARMIAHTQKTDPTQPRAIRIQMDHLEALLEKCLAVSLSERKKIPGLEPDRADIIVPGLAVIAMIMRKTGQRWLTISEGGVREGALLAIIENELQWPSETDSKGNPQGAAPEW